MGIGWFELYASGSPEWTATIESSLSALNIGMHRESVSILEEEAYRRLRKPPVAPHGWKLQLQDIPILSKAVRNSGVIPAQAAQGTSFGYRLMDGDRPVAVCKSIGFEAGNEFMVEVETFHKEDRGKGYATLVATALIDHALEHGLSPLWETTEDNVASRRLARRLGFVEAEVYPVYEMRIAHP
jgi:RimJ/RimL family protein N-acetyltransferase